MERRQMPETSEGTVDEEEQCFMEPLAAPPQRRRKGAIVLLAGIGGLVAVIAVGTDNYKSDRSGALGQTVQLEESDPNMDCHTASVGESCYIDVQWAMTDGIINHPEWYEASCSWLKPTNSFEEFQACVYRINQTSCPLPCNPKKSIPRHTESTTESTTPPALVEIRPDPCHIAKKGEICFNTVVQALVMDVHEFDTKFPGLQMNASFEEIQSFLHENESDGHCARPCSCHTVVPGEECFEHVVWAMKEGIKVRPTWYQGLSQDSSFEEVQAFLHMDAKGACPLPCSGITADWLRLDDLKAEAAGSKGADISVSCHTAIPGDSCYDNVVFAMSDGIFDHPDRYANLSFFSSFEDFQTSLHKDDPDSECPQPCACATAKPGDQCYDSVRWVLREGIKRNPQWYPGLTEKSRWETVQLRLHEDENTTCHTPCTPKVWGSPSVFCFAVFRSQGYELDLVKSQIKRGLGIFSCDEFAVLSDEELSITDDIKTHLIPPCEEVGISKDGTAANTLVFMQAWRVIWKDARYKAHDWVVKADPDAVVIVDRLRIHLEPFTGRNVFIKNCMKFTGPGWPMMFGSLEAISVGAIELYFENADRCKKELQWEAWGEDLFMGNCLTMLGANAEFDGGIIGDNVCLGANCADGTSAVYHPFKSEETWFECYEQAQMTVFKK